MGLDRRSHGRGDHIGLIRARQLVFHSDHPVEVEEFKLPEPGPGQIQVRHTHTHVSAGSEMNFYRTHPVDGPPAQATLGYMGAGRVLSVGPDVAGFTAGDPVVTCRNHASHWLVDLAETGPMRWYIERLDDRISDEAAGFVTLADVALHGVRRAGLQIDQLTGRLVCGIILYIGYL